jgi:hypothetical protein
MRSFHAPLPGEQHRITVRRTFVEVEEDELDDEDDISDVHMPWTRAQTDPVKVTVDRDLAGTFTPNSDFERAQTDPVKIDLMNKDAGSFPLPHYTSWCAGVANQAGGNPPFLPTRSPEGLPQPPAGTADQAFLLASSQLGAPYPPAAHGTAAEAPIASTTSSDASHLGFDITPMQLKALQEDPELAHVFHDIKRNRMEAALKHYQDEDLMLKISRKLCGTTPGQPPLLPFAPKPSSIVEETMRGKQAQHGSGPAPVLPNLAAPQLTPVPAGPVNRKHIEEAATPGTDAKARPGGKPEAGPPAAAPAHALDKNDQNQELQRFFTLREAVRDCRPLAAYTREGTTLLLAGGKTDGGLEADLLMYAAPDECSFNALVAQDWQKQVEKHGLRPMGPIDGSTLMSRRTPSKDVIVFREG